LEPARSEDHATLDPAAQRLARQVVNYATTSPLAPRTAVTYIGGAAGSALLNSLGVQFQSATTLPTSGLVVVGADATVSDAQLENFARGGGKVLFLPRRNATGAAGLRLAEKNRLCWLTCRLPNGLRHAACLHLTCAGAAPRPPGL
jgi:hypothetical protein